MRNGRSIFDDFAYRGLLNNEDKITQATETHPVTFVAFDVIATEVSHIKEPLFERKDLLTEIIEPSSTLAITPYVVGEGMDLFQLTKDRGLEGVIGKRIDSFYEIGKRSYDWLKYKHFKITTAVILGYKENPFTMMVGQYFKNGELKVVASIEFGFKPDEKVAFRQIAKDIITKTDKGYYWLKPLLCCNVQYLEETEKHKLRITSSKGFNFDVKPEDCIRGN